MASKPKRNLFAAFGWFVWKILTFFGRILLRVLAGLGIKAARKRLDSGSSRSGASRSTSRSSGRSHWWSRS